VNQRGDVCWADLGEPRGSTPAKRRPVLVIQADPYNASRLNTTLAAVITSNTGLAAMPGNVFVPAIASGLSRDSVVNVTALVTLDKTDLDPAVGQLTAACAESLACKPCARRHAPRAYHPVLVLDQNKPESAARMPNGGYLRLPTPAVRFGGDAGFPGWVPWMGCGCGSWCGCPQG
jgi:mRNA interferase MazF